MYKTFVFCVICVGAALGAWGRNEFPVQPVTDVPTAGKIWDMTHLEPVGHEIDYRVDDGETDRIWSTSKRFDFRTTAGDSVFQTCAETRAYRAVFSPGILRGLPGGMGGSESFKINGRIRQSQFVTGEGCSTVMPAVRGMAVTPSGDSIAGAFMIQDIITMRWCITADSLAILDPMPDSAVCVTTIQSYRLMVPFMPFPQAYKRVEETVLGGRIVSRDSMAWVMTGSPLAEMERVRRNLLPGSDYRNRPVQGDEPDDLTETIDISITGEEIVICGDGNTTADVVITDVLGREYYQGVSVPESRISISTLPRGEYLIQVVPSAGRTVARKFVK
ncbi:MAG: T9SS type A sorting domain-containing protein [Muribaculaceae bacterium]|nr:T9SS type A sorting domain-containing protein [Muribaculaceae bacterium]